MPYQLLSSQSLSLCYICKWRLSTIQCVNICKVLDLCINLRHNVLITAGGGGYLKTMVDSIAKLVEFLGGAHALAQRLHITADHIRIWLREEFIPSGFHLELYLMCLDHKLEVDLKKVFGLSTSNASKGKKDEEVRA